MKNKKILLKLLGILGVCAFWLLLWVLVSLRVHNELLFPSPASVIRSLGRLALKADFWVSTALSLARVLGGILISLALGSLLAVITERSSVMRALLSPLLNVVKSTPVASFIILALLWLDRGTLPLFITSLIVIPIVWSNVSEGIRSVDKELYEVTRVYGFSLASRLRRLYLPSVSPFFMAACRSSLGMAWKAGISAEVLSTPKNAIGTELYYSRVYLETSELFAWTAVVIILSVLIERLLVFALERSAAALGFSAKGEENDKA